MHRIDPMNREQATADLVDFCDTKLRFGQKKISSGIPRGIPYLLTEADFQISILFSSYSDIRYWNL